MSSVEAKDIVKISTILTFIEWGQSPSLGSNVGQPEDSPLPSRPRVSNRPASERRFVKLLPVHTINDRLYKFTHEYNSDTALTPGLS
jgi:hypothetical protein